jgi:hypothetical protein
MQPFSRVFGSTAMNALARSGLDAHLRVVVINLVAEQLLHRVHDARAAGNHAVDVFPRLVPECELDGRALAVGDFVGVGFERGIGFGGGAQDVHFLGVEQRADDDIAVAVEVGDLGRGENVFWHKATGLVVNRILPREISKR